jgi:hypothetical protein
MSRRIELGVKVPKRNASDRTWRRWWKLPPKLKETHIDQNS